MKLILLEIRFTIFQNKFNFPRKRPSGVNTYTDLFKMINFPNTTSFKLKKNSNECR